MALYGLIGYPLEHSFSARYFNEKFRAENIHAEYRNFPLPDISLLPALLAENPDLRGFNVTYPYKEQVIPYLDSLSAEAEAIGAVNCVVAENGSLAGYNTDWCGFSASLKGLIGDNKPRALILGTGGASKAARFALRQMGIGYTVVTSSPGADKCRLNEKCITYAEVDAAIMDAHKLIVNTTPLGMAPYEGKRPAIPYGQITPGHYLFDMIYNPAVTPFLEEGMRKGAQTRNGLEMLKLQAERSWEYLSQE